MTTFKKILVFDFCNYFDYPIGGYLSFAKYLLLVFGSDLALVGITTDKSDPVGKWFKKKLNGEILDYFALAYYNKSKTKHIIPDRLMIFLLLKFYKKQIQKIGINNVFVQRQEVLQSVKNFGYSNICYRFAGLENPLSISKYRYAHALANYFEYYFFKSLSQAKVILASGDEMAIQEMLTRSYGLITRNNVIQFPSRINTDIFKLIDKQEARKKLRISVGPTVVVTSGRLAWIKGWLFMIESFILFEKMKPGSIFYMIGDGEDQNKIAHHIKTNKMENKIILVGRKEASDVALYLNSANLFIMGSYKEGWSTSLIEAIACGIPACVTNFSSAKDIIQEGENGYVVNDHDTNEFSRKMFQACEIPLPVDNTKVQALAVNKLKLEILKVWELV